MDETQALLFDPTPYLAVPGPGQECCCCCGVPDVLVRYVCTYCQRYDCKPMAAWCPRRFGQGTVYGNTASAYFTGLRLEHEQRDQVTFAEREQMRDLADWRQSHADPPP